MPKDRLCQLLCGLQVDKEKVAAVHAKLGYNTQEIRKVREERVIGHLSFYRAVFTLGIIS